MINAKAFKSFIRYDEEKGTALVDRRMLGRVYAYARPYWLKIALVLVALLASSLLELIPPLLYRDLIDNVLPNSDLRRLNLLAIAMICIPVTSGLIGVAQRYLSSSVGNGIMYDLRRAMYHHLQRMSLRFFTHTRSGEIVSRFSNDVVGAQTAVTRTLPNFLSNSITLVSTLVVMISIEWRLALLSVAVLPLFLLPTRRVGRTLRSIRRQAMEHNADMSSIISETLAINGALLVKTFGRNRSEAARFADSARHVRDFGVRRALVGRWFIFGLGIAGAIGTALIYWVGGYLVLRGEITIGTIVAFAAYLVRLYGPISALTNVQVEFSTSMVSFERVFEYLDLPLEIVERPNPARLDSVEGRVRFENVSFNYQGKDDDLDLEALDHPEEGTEQPKQDPPPSSAAAMVRRRALSALSFTIEPGQLVALVGPSGAGKTTITYLLPRLYDPSVGQITLDGHDLRDLELESLAHQIGMVAQETYLFHDTVRANLMYARPGATQTELEAACKAANIHEFIAALPKGYDTLVGERGYRLSGGEKQRLSIARVILKNPRILVLDEATSHLDSQSEALIQGALEPLLQGRTSLVIAHRLSTILAADKILVLDQGRLVEEGSHAELLARGGLYAQLYETQFGS